MAELDAAIAHILNTDTELAAEARELVRWMIREARLVQQYGTQQAKAALISRGLTSILSHATTVQQTDQLADLRASLNEIRTRVFADVPVVGHAVQPDAPRDTPRDIPRATTAPTASRDIPPAPRDIPRTPTDNVIL